MNSLPRQEVALWALLVFAIPSAQAETRTFVDHAVLPMGELIEPDTWQEPLEGMLVRARERCAARANDLRVEINEVVPEESVETGILSKRSRTSFLVVTNRWSRRVCCWNIDSPTVELAAGAAWRNKQSYRA